MVISPQCLTDRLRLINPKWADVLEYAEKIPFENDINLTDKFNNITPNINYHKSCLVGMSLIKPLNCICNTCSDVEMDLYRARNQHLEFNIILSKWLNHHDMNHKEKIMEPVIVSNMQRKLK